MTTIPRFLAGENATFGNTFTVLGVNTDPTTIALTITDPAGTAVTYTYAALEITRTATGIYTKTVTVTLAGTWTGLWVGTGPASDSADFTFEVWPAADPNVYDVLTIGEAKARLSIKATLDSDAALMAAVTAVSRRLDQACGFIVRRDVTAEAYDGGQDIIRLRNPAYALTTVTEYQGTTGSVLTRETVGTEPDGYWAEPHAPEPTLFSGRLYRRTGGADRCWQPGRGNVTVTYTAGRYATTALVSPLFKRAAGDLLANWWRSGEPSVAPVGDFELPQRNFPTFGIPNAVKDQLRNEWREIPGIG